MKKTSHSHRMFECIEPPVLFSWKKKALTSDSEWYSLPPCLSWLSSEINKQSANESLRPRCFRWLTIEILVNLTAGSRLLIWCFFSLLSGLRHTHFSTEWQKRMGLSRPPTEKSWNNEHPSPVRTIYLLAKKETWITINDCGPMWKAFHQYQQCADSTIWIHFRISINE